MIKTFFLIIFLSFLFSIQSYSLQNENDDEDLSMNAIFLEAGGNGIGFSFNYERFFSDKIGIRVGAGSLILLGITTPIMINYYVGSKNNKLELGSGIIYIDYFEDDKVFGRGKSALLSMTIGLRHQKPGGGIVIRLSFTPLFNLHAGRFIPYAGLSLGYSF